MINLIQPITVQQAYDGITHARRWASWNWWWRMVDDDDSVESPSPEPRTDSRSALPMKNRRWRRLRIVKCDETSSLIFFLGESEFIALELGSVELRGAHKLPGRALGGARPGGLWGPCGSSAASPKLPGSVSFQKKSSKSLAAFGLHLIRIFWKTKNKQKIATGTGH